MPSSRFCLRSQRATIFDAVSARVTRHDWVLCCPALEFSQRGCCAQVLQGIPETGAANPGRRNFCAVRCSRVWLVAAVCEGYCSRTTATSSVYSKLHACANFVRLSQGINLLLLPASQSAPVALPPDLPVIVRSIPFVCKAHCTLFTCLLVHRWRSSKAVFCTSLPKTSQQWPNYRRTWQAWLTAFSPGWQRSAACESLCVAYFVYMCSLVTPLPMERLCCIKA